jgi:hypothetical protein
LVDERYYVERRNRRRPVRAVWIGVTSLPPHSHVQFNGFRAGRLYELPALRATPFNRSANVRHLS